MTRRERQANDDGDLRDDGKAGQNISRESPGKPPSGKSRGNAPPRETSITYESGTSKSGNAKRPEVPSISKPGLARASHISASAITASEASSNKKLLEAGLEIVWVAIKKPKICSDNNITDPTTIGGSQLPAAHTKEASAASKRNKPLVVIDLTDEPQASVARPKPNFRPGETIVIDSDSESELLPSACPQHSPELPLIGGSGTKPAQVPDMRTRSSTSHAGREKDSEKPVNGPTRDRKSKQKIQPKKASRRGVNGGPSRPATGDPVELIVKSRLAPVQSGSKPSKNPAILPSSPSNPANTPTVLSVPQQATTTPCRNLPSSQPSTAKFVKLSQGSDASTGKALPSPSKPKSKLVQTQLKFESFKRGRNTPTSTLLYTSPNPASKQKPRLTSQSQEPSQNDAEPHEFLVSVQADENRRRLQPKRLEFGQSGLKQSIQEGQGHAHEVALELHEVPYYPGREAVQNPVGALPNLSRGSNETTLDDEQVRLTFKAQEVAGVPDVSRQRASKRPENDSDDEQLSHDWKLNQKPNENTDKNSSVQQPILKTNESDTEDELLDPLWKPVAKLTRHPDASQGTTRLEITGSRSGNGTQKANLEAKGRMGEKVGEKVTYSSSSSESDDDCSSVDEREVLALLEKFENQQFRSSNLYRKGSRQQVDDESRKQKSRANKLANMTRNRSEANQLAENVSKLHGQIQDGAMTDKKDQEVLEHALALLQVGSENPEVERYKEELQKDRDEQAKYLAICEGTSSAEGFRNHVLGRSSLVSVCDRKQLASFSGISDRHLDLCEAQGLVGLIEGALSAPNRGDPFAQDSFQSLIMVLTNHQVQVKDWDELVEIHNLADVLRSSYRNGLANFLLNMVTEGVLGPKGARGFGMMDEDGWRTNSSATRLRGATFSPHHGNVERWFVIRSLAALYLSVGDTEDAADKWPQIMEDIISRSIRLFLCPIGQPMIQSCISWIVQQLKPPLLTMYDSTTLLESLYFAAFVPLLQGSRPSLKALMEMELFHLLLILFDGDIADMAAIRAVQAAAQYFRYSSQDFADGRAELAITPARLIGGTSGTQDSEYDNQHSTDARVEDPQESEKAERFEMNGGIVLQGSDQEMPVVAGSMTKDRLVKSEPVKLEPEALAIAKDEPHPIMAVNAGTENPTDCVATSSPTENTLLRVEQARGTRMVCIEEPVRIDEQSPNANVFQLLGNNLAEIISALHIYPDFENLSLVLDLVLLLLNSLRGKCMAGNTRDEREFHHQVGLLKKMLVRRPTEQTLECQSKLASILVYLDMIQKN